MVILFASWTNRRHQPRQEDLGVLVTIKPTPETVLRQERDLERLREEFNKFRQERWDGKSDIEFFVSRFAFENGVIEDSTVWKLCDELEDSPEWQIVGYLFGYINLFTADWLAY